MRRDASRAAAQEKSHAQVLAHLGAPPHQHQSNLPGAFNVRTAARLQVRGLNFDSAQDAFSLDFFSHSQFRKFVRGLAALRSEEHTSELQSHLNLVCRLLLEETNSPPPQPRP